MQKFYLNLFFWELKYLWVFLIEDISEISLNWLNPLDSVLVQVPEQSYTRKVMLIGCLGMRLGQSVHAFKRTQVLIGDNHLKHSDFESSGPWPPPLNFFLTFTCTCNNFVKLGGWSLTVIRCAYRRWASAHPVRTRPQRAWPGWWPWYFSGSIPQRTWWMMKSEA